MPVTAVMICLVSTDGSSEVRGWGEEDWAGGGVGRTGVGARGGGIEGI